MGVCVEPCCLEVKSLNQNGSNGNAKRYTTTRKKDSTVVLYVLDM